MYSDNESFYNLINNDYYSNYTINDNNTVSNNNKMNNDNTDNINNINNEFIDKYYSVLNNNNIDNYYSFIAGKNSLFSFSKDGNLTKVFFPEKDYYQNLGFSFSWIVIGNEIIPLNNKYFYIKISFDYRYETLKIIYYPGEILIKKLLEKNYFINNKENKIIKDFIKNKEKSTKRNKKGNEKEHLKRYRQYIKKTGYYLVKEIKADENNSDLLIDLNSNNFKNILYIDYFNWKIKDSENFHSITIKEDKNKFPEIKIFKQEIEINFKSKNLTCFYPVSHKENVTKIEKKFFNYLKLYIDKYANILNNYNLLNGLNILNKSNNLNNKNKFDKKYDNFIDNDFKNKIKNGFGRFSIIRLNNNNGFDQFFINNFELISNNYFSIYEFTNSRIKISYNFINKNNITINNLDINNFIKNNIYKNNFDINNLKKNNIDKKSINKKIINKKIDNNKNKELDYKALLLDNKLDLIQKSSIYVLLKLQTESGAILASYEQDEKFEKSGGYGFCWGRDAAIIANIMSKIGFKQFPAKFFQFIFNSLEKDDHIHQRYYSNGFKAPSWGDQYDETGLVLWSLNNYYKKYKDKEIINKNKEKILTLIKFLIKIFDEELFLFSPSFDLWEERYGYHLFTQISCIEGLKAGYELLIENEIFDNKITDNKIVENNFGKHENINKENINKESVNKKYINKKNINKKNINKKNNKENNTEHNLYLKELEKVKKYFNNDFASFYSKVLENILNTFIQIEKNDIKVYRSFIYNFSNNNENYKDEISDFSNKNIKLLITRGFFPDSKEDVSNLAVIYPFSLDFISIEHKLRLIEITQKGLLNKSNNFHFRYRDDGYMGGNSWIISTLWILISKIELFEKYIYKDYQDKKISKSLFEKSDNFKIKLEELKKEINNIIKNLFLISNSCGFLPEQIDNNMNPLWIQPLAWTHALVLELYNKKNTLGGNL